MSVEAAALDLSSLASVRAFAERFLAGNRSLDVLMLNAGIMATPFGLTADGIEQQFGVNHVGHHYLTALLLPVRVVTVAGTVPCWCLRRPPTDDHAGSACWTAPPAAW